MQKAEDEEASEVVDEGGGNGDDHEDEEGDDVDWGAANDGDLRQRREEEWPNAVS